MIYWTPDLHIAKNIRKSCKQTRNDSYTALRHIQRIICSDPEAKAVVLPGDIFNTAQVTGKSINAFLSFLDALADKDIQVLAIQGNHDKDEEESLPTAMGAINIDKKLVKVDGTSIFGLDYRPSTILKEDLKEVPPCDVLVLHGAYGGLVTLETMIDYRQEDIPAHVQNVFTGHVHIAAQADLPNGGHVVSPGVMHPCAIDQGGEHYLYRWKKGMPSWEQVVIPTRPIHRVHICALEDVQSVKDILAGIVQGTGTDLVPIMEIEFLADFWAPVKEIELQYKDKAIFFEKPYSAGKLMETALKNTELCQKISLKEALPFAVDAEKQPEVYSLLEELLDSTDANTVAERFIIQG
jgi:DNA repair exonuclease SbcCD nuclease subunit